MMSKEEQLELPIFGGRDREHMPELLVNAIKTPDGTILESRYRHDYQSYTDSITGETYSVDGGLDYRSGTYTSKGVTNLSLYSDDPHDKIREGFTWGTYGKCGTLPKHYLKLKDMTTDHINAILTTQFHITKAIRKAFEDELEWRNENECHIYE